MVGQKDNLAAKKAAPAVNSNRKIVPVIMVAVISFSDSMTGEINHKLEKYGANILIVPRTESLSLSYGGVSMGGVSFSQDDQLIFTTLPSAQQILNKQGIVSVVEIAALCQGCPIPEMVRQISEVLPNARVMAIQQVVKGRMEALSQFKLFSVGISGVVMLVGSLVVFVTMMGNVRERTEEIGIFRAVGFRKRHIMRIIFIEAGIISITAGIIGYLVGEAGSRVAMGFLIETHEHVMPMNFHLPAGAIMMALMIGLAAAVYPALVASRMDPVRALKTI